jgi:EAL domain-containing protein (putative c-di-GMP-specific phosphodiesterase class I)
MGCEALAAGMLPAHGLSMMHTTPSPALAARPSVTSSRRVCILEDEPALRTAYARALRFDGFDVHDTDEPEAAIAAVRRGEIDLVISDVGLGASDGVEVMRALRAVDPDLPVVLMSGSASLPSALKAIEYGALRYLQKPLGREDLAKAANDGLCVRATALERRAAIERAAMWEVKGSASERSVVCAMASSWMMYQPVVRPSTREVFGYEALLRSCDPELTTPPRLIAAAERLGKLPALGRRIRENVAEMIAWSNTRPRVMVNLHPNDLLDDQLYAPDAPLSRVARHVVLELTESAPLEAIDGLPSRVDALRRLGFTIAIDDLGSGYSALNSFARIRPDIVKLDMALIRGIDTDQTKQKVVSMLTALCRDLGIVLIAEGVETDMEWRALTDAGCELFQGHLFARPGNELPVVDWR